MIKYSAEDIVCLRFNSSFFANFLLILHTLSQKFGIKLILLALNVKIYPMKVILASKSPRRKEILQNLNIDFDVVPSYCDEICGKTKPEDIVCELAERKAKSIDSQDIVIGSDTIVVYDGQVFGKPKDRDDAYQMLKSLQDS